VEETAPIADKMVVIMFGNMAAAFYVAATDVLYL